MGAELPNDNESHMMAADEGYISDSDAMCHVIDILDGVAMAHNMVAQDDQDQYDHLVSIMDPRNRGVDEQALLVTAVKALTGAIYKINIVYHSSLLSNIFSMSIWNYGFDARNAVLELITNLAAMPDQFLDSCLNMLVSNFLPPRGIRESRNHPRIAEKSKIHSELHEALHHITNLVPLAPRKLRVILDRRMPKHTDPKEVIDTFVECMLGLDSNEIGDFLGNTVLAKVVELLTDLDVNISLEDILQEEHNKDMFDMELEDVEKNADDVAGFNGKPLYETGGGLKGNAFAEKLDSLMMIICEHLKSCAYNGRLVEVFGMLKEPFRKVLMNAYKSKFAQFVMFYACSLDPENCGGEFAYFLTHIFISKEDSISRMSAVAYLASYLARAKFVSSSVVASIVEGLVGWCAEYCQLDGERKKPASQLGRHFDYAMNPKAHQIFYSGCQAVMYILCFRMRTLMDVPLLKAHLCNLPLETILRHSLAPLKVCLPTIVQEFMRQAEAAHLFKTSVPFLSDNTVLESELSKSFGGKERLDTFFPFDPYLLKESDRFMRPNFEFWFLVKTTYSDNSDAGDEDLDTPDFASNDQDDEGVNSDDDDDDDDGDDDDDDGDGDDDDLGYSMNKMSITPRTSHYPISGNRPIHTQMPARIRPSVSPED